jgi:hypothetical protein
MFEYFKTTHIEEVIKYNAANAKAIKTNGGTEEAIKAHRELIAAAKAELAKRNAPNN